MHEGKREDAEARQLLGAMRGALARGDYRQARLLGGRVEGLTQDAEILRQMRNELSALRLDRAVVAAGVLALVAYVVAWVLAL